MIRSIIILWRILTITIIRTINPIKIRITLVFIRALSFQFIQTQISNSWISLIFILLFIGGILIIFMILSSLLPNEKSLKIKSIFICLFIIQLILIVSRITYQIIYTQIKWIIQSRASLEFIIILITIYFISFVYILSKNEQTIRSKLCHNSLIL